MLEGKVTYVNHDCFAPLSNLCRSRSHFYNERPSKIRYGYNNVKYGSGSGFGQNRSDPAAPAPAPAPAPHHSGDHYNVLNIT